MKEVRSAFKAAPLARLLLAFIVVGALFVSFLCVSTDTLGVKASPTITMADDMPLSEQEKQEALGEMNLAGSSDMDRMIAESEERWRNRPRVIPTEDTRGFEISEPRVCRLPNGGVSAGVIAQLKRNRAAREAEKKEERQEPNIEL